MILMKAPDVKRKILKLPKILVFWIFWEGFHGEFLHSYLSMQVSTKGLSGGEVGIFLGNSKYFRSLLLPINEEVWEFGTGEIKEFY